MPGPVPYRTEELSRERDAKRGDRPTLTKGTMRPVQIPAPDDEWHPTAKRLYQSLRESGQSDFFQNSDWAFAWSLCEDVSVMKNQQIYSGKLHAESLKGIYNALSNLMFTEADRRRMRIELMEEKTEEKTVGDEVVAGYRANLRVV